MSDILGASLTAATANLLFLGQKVGELQSLSWNENNNYRRISGIGNAIDVQHVPGIAQYDLTARRAFLESDLVLDLISSMVMDGNYQVGGVTPFQGVKPTATSNAFKNAALTLESLKTALQNGQGNIELGDKIANIYFDVQIQNATNNTLFVFGDCSINTRRASIDINGIIIMSDITMLARKKSMDVSSQGAAELNLA